MKNLLIFFFILCFILPVTGMSEASPVWGWEWWDAPLNAFNEAGDRLKRAMLDKNGESVPTAPVIQDDQIEKKTNTDNPRNVLQTTPSIGISISGNAVPEKPSVFSYAYDYTSTTLSKDQIDEITKEGERLYEKTGVQAVTLVTNTFGDSDDNEFVTNVINLWGIGSRERNDGVLIALAVEERKIEIGTGSGIDTILNDSLCGEILDANLNFFEKGDFGEGLVAIYKDVSDFFISRLEEKNPD